MVTTSDSTTAPEVTYYYGKCPDGAGVKFHTGHEVVPYTRDDSIYAVKTHCGNQIFQENEGVRPPDVPTDELCKTCYRSFAWAEMQKALANRRQVEDDVAARLDDLASRAENGDMGAIGIIREVRGLAEQLRHTVQSVSNGETRGGNLRVVPSASA